MNFPNHSWERVSSYSSNKHFTSTELNLQMHKVIEYIHFTAFFDFKRQQISRHASKETHIYTLAHTFLLILYSFCSHMNCSENVQSC